VAWGSEAGEEDPGYDSWLSQESWKTPRLLWENCKSFTTDEHKLYLYVYSYTTGYSFRSEIQLSSSNSMDAPVKFIWIQQWLQQEIALQTCMYLILQIVLLLINISYWIPFWCVYISLFTNASNHFVWKFLLNVTILGPMWSFFNPFISFISLHSWFYLWFCVAQDAMARSAGQPHWSFWCPSSPWFYSRVRCSTGIRKSLSGRSPCQLWKIQDSCAKRFFGR